MPWLFSKAFRDQHAEKIREIKALLGKGYLSRKSKAFERQMKANTAHDTRGSLSQIHAHTLIMVGGHDELTPPRMAEELMSEIPNSKLLTFEQGGHGLYWETPQLFNKAVLNFLNGHI